MGKQQFANYAADQTGECIDRVVIAVNILLLVYEKNEVNSRFQTVEISHYTF